MIPVLKHPVPDFLTVWSEDLNNLGDNLPDYVVALNDCRVQLDEIFFNDGSIEILLHAWSAAIDKLLVKLWSLYGLDKYEGLSLIAVGGYGRSELHPGSDIDLLILLEEEESKELAEDLSAFLTSLWDVKLDVGHSVRTLEECIAEADADLSTMTNLLECRLLSGCPLLLERNRNAIWSSQTWDDQNFYLGKIQESAEREERYGDKTYSLEPNIKESPGGLRDIQTIKWIATRHFGTDTLAEIIDDHLLTENEYKRLIRARDFLWRVRWALHREAGRKEDRLLMDYQHVLAEQFGYTHEIRNKATEAFMHEYYRNVMTMNRLTHMILQLFEYVIIAPVENSLSRKIGNDYSLRNGYLEINDPDIFETRPEILLEVFLTRMRHPEAKDIAVSTERLIRDNIFRIDDDFRHSPLCRSMFMDIMRHGDGITHALRSMNSHGVLGAYLPSFGKIMGMMQFDMFHIYTVDEHTMMVLTQTRRLALDCFISDHPEGHQVFKELPKPEILYLSALFHDIAKGRGGNHATLGAKEALEFATAHGLSNFDAQTLSWIVERHLDMSMTAQRMDISDPDVIKDFAAKIKSPLHLKYLYLLTISDIRGTNPSLWNDWKSSLLSSLYHRTLQWLTQVTSGSEHMTQAQYIRDTKFETLRAIGNEELDEQEVLTLWEDFSPEYFRRYEPDEIIWHTKTLLEHNKDASKNVFVNPEIPRGATEILICAPSHPGFFMLATRGIEQFRLSIVNAKVYTTRSKIALDTFSVLEEDGMPCTDPYRIADIIERLNTLILNPDRDLRVVQQPLPRQLRCFNTPAQITFSNNDEWQDTLMDISAPDYPGLLADVAHVLHEHKVNVKIARIATVSERAQDILHVHTAEHKPLNFREQQSLRKSLLTLIQSRLTN